MINITICDDDKNILEYLNKLLGKIIKIDYRIENFTSGYDLENYIKNIVYGNVQIVIIDIDLKDHLGIDIVKSIQSIYPHIKIIFMTGYVGYVEDIFEVDALYYLAKPIKEDKLKKSLDKALEAIESDKGKVVNLSMKGKVISLDLNKICYMESQLRIVIIHGDDFEQTVYKKLKEIENILPVNFIRCHQSYIVNIDKVEKLTSNYFLINNGAKVPISQSKYKSTKEKFLEYLGENL